MTIAEHERLSDENLPAEIQALMGLYLLHGRLAAQLESVEMTAPITKQERHVILRLYEPRRIGDLAREIGALPSSMTPLADGLCKKGLLARTRDPDDGRAQLIALSAKGEAIRARLTTEAAKVLQTQAGLTGAEAETLTDLMRKVRRHMAATCPGKDAGACC